jgi:hypothetical protein
LLGQGPLAHRADLGERAVVGKVGRQRALPVHLLELVVRPLEALAIAAVEQDPPAALRDLCRQPAAEAVGAAGDEHGMAGEIGQAARSSLR